MFHYTDDVGWKAIRSQVPWVFKTSQPQDPDRPKGAYFTDLEPSAVNLRVLHKKLRVPREKQHYVFQFMHAEGLKQLNNGMGRDKRIFSAKSTTAWIATVGNTKARRESSARISHDRRN